MKKVVLLGLAGSLLIPTIGLDQASLTANAARTCGPSSYPWMSDAWYWINYPWGGIFEPACIKHDQNYALANRDPSMTQTQADNIFKADMYRACESKWNRVPASPGKAWRWISSIFSNQSYRTKLIRWCQKTANNYYYMVSEFGEDVGSVGTNAKLRSLKISNPRISRSDDWLSDDEIKITFKARNNGNSNIEIDAVMMKKGKYMRHIMNPGALGRIATSLNNDVADVEPDTHEVDLKPGQTWNGEVDTNWGWPSQEDLGNPVYVYIRADVLGQDLFTPMARLKCKKPSSGRSGGCEVSYLHGDTWKSQSQMDAFKAELRKGTPVDSSSNRSTSVTKSCTSTSNYGIWAFKAPSSNKYVRGGITAEGRRDLVAALGAKPQNPRRGWGSFRLYSIPGVRYGRRIRNTIDGRWLETINNSNTVFLPSGRRCTVSNQDMKWKVIPVGGGRYTLQSMRNNKFVRLQSNGLLKVVSNSSGATKFKWEKLSN